MHQSTALDPLRHLMYQSIGLAAKDYSFMYYTLIRNIGQPMGAFDGYATPIGQMADQHYNELSQAPWFIIDEKKQNTINYFDYIDKTYFNETKGLDINSFADGGQPFDINVGVKRGSGLLIDSPSSISPNGSNDSMLGEISQYYLRTTLANAREKYGKNRKTSNITRDAYDYFGLEGDLGARSIEDPIENTVRLNGEMMEADVIPWSTADHAYDANVAGGGGNKNLVMVQNMYSLPQETKSAELRNEYTDDFQRTSSSSKYYPFGNYYSLTYSMGLYNSSSEKTKNFINKSMLGYDLLGKDVATLDMSTDSVISTPKKYFAGIGTHNTYLDNMVGGRDIEHVMYQGTTNEDIVRLKLLDAGNDSLLSVNAHYTYAEARSSSVTGSTLSTSQQTYNLGTAFGSYAAYDQTLISAKQDIITYTNKKFQEAKYDTLIARFHSDKPNPLRGKDLTSTAISKQYGMSHGRNLLKKNPSIEQGYDNPYCRVWTYHHQYSTLADTIRPFKATDGKIAENRTIQSYSTTEGRKRLDKYGAKGENGLVQFAPTTNDRSKKGSIKNCMFSIENLAWKHEKDFFKYHPSQKGPQGGRIMWFPPYGLTFSENSNASWGENQFIGRGEKIYTYTDTQRSGNLSFMLLIDHPSLINKWRGATIGDVDDIDSGEQELLRFFAGCDLIEAKPEEKKDKKQEVVIPPEEVPMPTVTEEVTGETSYDQIVFYVFYPNNYSGVDDDANDAMLYLINGAGPNFQLSSGSTRQLPMTNTHRFIGYEMEDTSKGLSNGQKHSPTAQNLLMYSMNGVDVAYYKCQNRNGRTNYWGYRVDKIYEQQILKQNVQNSNYSDKGSCKLNCSTEGGKYYGEEMSNLYSLIDVYCAVDPSVKPLYSGVYNESTVQEIRKRLSLDGIEDGYEMELSVSFSGSASSHGYTTANKVLNKNRANTVKNWLINKLTKSPTFNDNNLEFEEEVGTMIGAPLTTSSVSDFEAKVQRFARVQIDITKSALTEPNNEGDGITNVSVVDTYTSNLNVKDNHTSRDIDNAVEMARSTSVESLEDVKTNIEKAQNDDSLTSVQKAAYGSTMEEKKSEIEQTLQENIDDANSTELTENAQEHGASAEYEFFSELKANQPLLHHRIVDKIQYFDPAFHSITPEGFNARLTFLNQCTRQGSTYTNTDMNNPNRSATNLAFGTPPICVLRIGDFYNTKIIIRSLQIDYDTDGMHWDLNDEGIGVMPMMARVSIGFEFIGGSDLSGPIARLQNAVSFNYYANTEVYDDRSDVIE